MENRFKDSQEIKQKRLLQSILEDVCRDHIEYYYDTTCDIAREIEMHIKKARNMSISDRVMLKCLSRRDIQMLLSLH